MPCTDIIKFQSLFNARQFLVFLYDADGHVPLDDLSGRAREHYFYARAVVGREFAFPAIFRDSTAQ